MLKIYFLLLIEALKLVEVKAIPSSGMCSDFNLLELIPVIVVLIIDVVLVFDSLTSGRHPNLDQCVSRMQKRVLADEIPGAITLRKRLRTKLA